MTDVAEKLFYGLGPMSPVGEIGTRRTVGAIAGICRECGRTFHGMHESTKCPSCRTYREEWKDVD